MLAAYFCSLFLLLFCVVVCGALLCKFTQKRIICQTDRQTHFVRWSSWHKQHELLLLIHCCVYLRVICPVKCPSVQWYDAVIMSICPTVCLSVFLSPSYPLSSSHSISPLFLLNALAIYTLDIFIDILLLIQSMVCAYT